MLKRGLIQLFKCMDRMCNRKQAMPRSASAGIELIVHSTERLALQFAGRDVDNN